MRKRIDFGYMHQNPPSDAAKEKILALDDQYQAPPDRRKDKDERDEPVEITSEEFDSHPGAYRIPGFLGDEEDGDEEDYHFHGTITIPVTTLASSHAFVSQPEFVVPIARTVDSKIFEAVPMMLGWSDNREESYWPSS